ncbi:putative Nicotinamide N-methyltransferase [Hypsibius exemplaris]|uniref:Nicotinamide N-methyltransferase n=1 Tax=Hypsibius exemplaris TaxID=2072580 RepID=A0A9X6N9Q7_HYPEX|nr:putative Nicotinamide N-methyltransferase [Hypsibius exemplaris]
MKPAIIYSVTGFLILSLSSLNYCRDSKLPDTLNNLDEQDLSWTDNPNVNFLSAPRDTNASSDASESSFDKKSAAFLTKKLPQKLRQALVLTFEAESLREFIRQCMKKRLCTQNEVLQGVGGTPWVFQVRHRRGMMRFWHVYECVMRNSPSSCPVDGVWSKWNDWGVCSVSCGRGFRERKRRCDSPVPRNYGRFCAGSVKERESCAKTCPRNFTVMAGQDPLRLQALKTMTQTEKAFPSVRETCSKDHCTYHEVHHVIGDDAVANQYWLSMHCIERYIGCPVDGEWSDWQPWSACTSDCGIGDRYRIRRCSDPAPSNGGSVCEGESFQREDCLGLSCGGGSNESRAAALALFPLWSEWSDWSKCNALGCREYGTEYSKRICVGLTPNSMCDVGNGTKVSSLQRKRPCVKAGCLKNFNPLEYLDVYYNLSSQHSDFNKWSLVELKALIEKLPNGSGRLLEIGNGGVISRLISAAHNFTQITVCDRSEKVLDEVRAFVANNSTFDWSSTFRFVADLHGERDSAKMETQLRGAIKDIRKCDVTQADLFAPSTAEVPAVDLVVSAFTLEVATQTVAGFSKALQQITDRYVKPGGAIILIVSVEETYWQVNNNTFHVLYINKSHVEAALKAAGFEDIDMRQFDMRSHQPVSLIDNAVVSTPVPTCELCDFDAAGILIAKGVKRMREISISA